MKIYLMLHNILLLFVIRLYMSRQTVGWRNIATCLQCLLLVSSIFGLSYYVLPIYNETGALKKADVQKEEGDWPWIQVLLVGSVTLPLVIISIFGLTICLVICVYIKENIRGIKRFMGISTGERELRPDRNYENHILRQQFASQGPDHIELHDQIMSEDEDEDAAKGRNSRRELMQFYLEMMPKVKYTKQQGEEVPDGVDQLHFKQTACYPLCDKEFKNGEMLR